ncbi:phosphatases II [Xylona heveae TC161]|uniref:protein-tyrosine-phosphatase n=1 Tax=Xylona heveae (strain CBS 132557 / TC161) TaxID=1328760 RepID=A0A165HKS6_XYLHT|nr:phosphatases II [Xylona heveae TC161]KZF23662.1 phosphatases II [Xylona heveae TC161]
MPSSPRGPSRLGMLPSFMTNCGQVLEYIQDRLYLASYENPPDENTPFPYPKEKKSPGKRSKQTPVATPPPAGSAKGHAPVYFTVDYTLYYNSFHADFGPLHIGHLYRFAVQLHDILGDPANSERPVVLWSSPDSRNRANAACILACYMVLIQNWPPHLALAPIAQMDPPPMPFRDAGYSQADYTLSIQDVVYGVWKAKEEGLCGLMEFSLEEYEKFERVDMGDFNWLTPSFLAFASPQHSPTAPIPPSSPLYAKLPTSVSAVMASDLPVSFKNVLSHFATRDIGLVVRLNSELYSPSYFTALGINHLDMIFDDGTCPPLPLVKKFIKLAHEMINVKHKGIAVHCKAGLGRTGCLIGAYLIYRHGFTANEVIAFMRFMRPGMVVGPQQHWLHLNQGTFREWWWEDSYKEKLAAMLPSTPTKSSQKQRMRSQGPTATPVNSKRAALGEIDSNESSVATQDENLPAPTPGQPRKGSRSHEPRHHPYSRKISGVYDSDANVQQSAEFVSMHRQSRSDSESEEEWQLRMHSRRTASRSPQSSDKKRSVSYTTTTTTKASYSIGQAGESDIENYDGRPKTPTNSKSGSGSGAIGVAKVRSSPRRSADSRAAREAGVRKTSGRVGSMNGTLKSSGSK